jgi:hypothetical protein
MEISTIGIDLSKTTFHLIGLSPRGDIVLRKKLSRKQLLTYTASSAYGRIESAVSAFHINQHLCSSD